MLETTEAKTTRLAQEAERRRIARELHDNAIQSLTALVNDMAYLRLGKHADNAGSMEDTMLSKLEEWHELAQESLFAIRQTLSGLRPQDDQSFDLEAAVEALLTSLQHAGYLVTFESSSWPVSLPSGYASHLFYIIREALINISKHAHASTIIVSMSGFEDRLSISVSDDGIGIPSGAEQHTQTTGLTSALSSHKDQTNGYHQGLTVLRERVALLGGNLSFANEAITGKGTRLEVEIPLPLKNSTSVDSYD
jgi:signal transduction histidine kinase